MNLEEIQAAIGKLTPDEFAQLKASIPQLEDTSFDQRIAADFEAGKLNKLIDEAIQDDEQGRTTPL